MPERKLSEPGARRRLPAGLHWWVLAAAAVIFVVTLFASQVAGA